MDNIRYRLAKFGQTSSRKKSIFQLKYELENDSYQTTEHIPKVSGDDGEPVDNSVNLENQTRGGMKKCLNVTDLLAFGVGAIIGAGIFVLTGVAAHDKAGPAVLISYLISGFACALSGLCYAEFASRVPCSGSTYSYSYIVVGELVAWIIGWDLTLEYMIASATVARGWSGYLKSIIEAGGGYLPHPFAPIHLAQGFSLDLIAFFSVIALTLIIAFGMKESARFNKIFVVIKIAIVLFVIVVGSIYADTNNWKPFNPYGTRGIFGAAAITFFAYLGFDGVCNVAEEVKNPQRDIPIGILGSLGISTVLYVGVAVVLTLMVPYDMIDVDAPLSRAFQNLDLKWAQIIVAIGAFSGLTTAQLSGLISQPRLYYSLSRDGLLPKWFSYIHPKYQTPFYATLFTGACCAVIGMFVEISILADMVSIGTLLSFTLVSTCILILRYPVSHSASLSNSKYPVNRFPLFLQNPAYVVCFIIVFAAVTSASYVYSLSWVITLVFGLFGLAFSVIPFFFKETEENESTSINASKKSFKCPWVPLIPVVSVWANTYLMLSLSWQTWVRLVVWLIIGLLIYVFYGQKNSKLGKEQELDNFNLKYQNEELDSAEESNTNGNDENATNDSTNDNNHLKIPDSEKQPLSPKMASSPLSKIKFKTTPNGLYGQLPEDVYVEPISLSNIPIEDSNNRNVGDDDDNNDNNDNNDQDEKPSSSDSSEGESGDLKKEKDELIH
ncbi:hypothetical protein CYY_000661 [Polysphondylium violaceum]|uniref:Cationic amino acid transporter C-terminal domain-containing protein n=1 Tax=Polysphondylium violaceum TaxID=133409 RepID=A0A8J4Q131_9MYCE|nr:hypothetical protein CYY_000661 [Polysphondylium violaceum]